MVGQAEVCKPITQRSATGLGSGDQVTEIPLLSSLWPPAKYIMVAIQTKMKESQGSEQPRLPSTQMRAGAAEGVSYTPLQNRQPGQSWAGPQHLLNDKWVRQDHGKSQYFSEFQSYQLGRSLGRGRKDGVHKTRAHDFRQ